MSQMQKDKAIKEILDDSDKMVGDRIAHQNHKLSKDDKTVADMIGQVDGGMKSSEVSVDNSGAKDT